MKLAPRSAGRKRGSAQLDHAALIRRERVVKLGPALPQPVLGLRVKTVGLEDGRCTMQAEGIANRDFLVRAVLAHNVVALVDYALDVPHVGTWRGDWIVSGLFICGEVDGIATFSATIQSDGALVFTPVPPAPIRRRSKGRRAK